MLYGSMDGNIAPVDELRIPVTDQGLIRGDGVFEVVRVYEGRPYALREHLERMQRSADNLRLPIDVDALRSDLDGLSEAQPGHDGLLRLFVTRGEHRVLLHEPLPQLPPVMRLATITFAPTRILDGVKSLSYAANMQATRIARGRGADEALLVRPDGVVLEAPTSAIFWTTDGGELRTPTREVGILNSITRGVVCERFDVVEGEFDIDDALGAREAFLASTSREIQSVAAIDDRELQPGPHATAASESLAEAVAEALGSAAR
jgi:branched-chain amino acid aminotransferase